MKLGFVALGADSKTSYEASLTSSKPASSQNCFRSRACCMSTGVPAKWGLDERSLKSYLDMNSD